MSENRIRLTVFSLFQHLPNALIMTTAIFAFFAGLFAGAFALSCFVIYLTLRNIKELNAERKRFINKSLVRDGQATIFPQTDIDPDTDHETSKPSGPISLLSPLRRGRQNLRDSATNEHKTVVPGTFLPPDVKSKITEAAENAKNAA